MTYEELLEKISQPNEFLGVKYAPDWQHSALWSVVRLHSPEGKPEQQCRNCKRFYPCHTIQAIIKELQ